MELRKILIILCIILMIPNGINISAMQIKSEICIKTEDEAKIEGLIENQKQYLYDYNADEIKKLKEVYKNINNDKKIFNKIKLTKESKKELKEYFNKTYKELSTAFKYRIRYLEKNKYKYIEKSKIAYENSIEAYEKIYKEVLENSLIGDERENIIGKSDKKFNVISDDKPSSVRNDVTGNWRLTRIATTEDILEYIRSYYITKFIDEEEIHAIVNFTLNTTTQVSKLFENIICVTIYDYVEKEELDAKRLFGGTILGEYWIYLDNGDIEVIY